MLRSRWTGATARSTLSVENDVIRATLDTVPLNHWLVVTATGRDGGARLLVAGQPETALEGTTTTVPSPEGVLT